MNPRSSSTSIPSSSSCGFLSPSPSSCPPFPSVSSSPPLAVHTDVNDACSMPLKLFIAASTSPSSFRPFPFFCSPRPFAYFASSSAKYDFCVLAFFFSASSSLSSLPSRRRVSFRISASIFSISERRVSLWLAVSVPERWLESCTTWSMPYLARAFP